MATRIVHTDDAIEWLKNHQVLEGSSLLGSLPDISEFQQWDLPTYKTWFKDVARLILEKTPATGVTLFFQSDIKYEGTWLDKGYLCQKAAEEVGHELLWHKIICRAPAGTITFGRPAFSHLLCFSKELRIDTSKSTPDVIPDMGEKIWERGMGLNACIAAAKFIKQQTNSHTLINPFCGQGSMLAAANAFELDAIGIEKSPKRASRARELQLSPDQKSWI